MVVLLGCLSVNAVERKEIALDSINLTVVCNTVQIHHVYGAADAATESEADDCSALSDKSIITVEQGTLYVDKGSDYEGKYTIISCTFCTSKVFKDTGEEEIYSFVCKDEQENTLTITYEKVKNRGKTHDIITIPSYNDVGVLFRVTSYWR